MTPVAGACVIVFACLAAVVLILAFAAWAERFIRKDNDR